MPYVDIVTALALLQFLVFGIRVSRARTRYGVPAPAITGNAVFECYFRVQQNTLELLIIFIPALYLFSRYFNPAVAAGLGVVYLVGREIYAAGYVKEPKKRSAGFLLSAIPIVILLVGAAVGAVRYLIYS
jgi:glutathione S-transferase